MSFLANLKKIDSPDDDELVSQVAEAPKILPTMQSIKELDRSVKFALPSVLVRLFSSLSYDGNVRALQTVRVVNLLIS